MFRLVCLSERAEASASVSHSRDALEILPRHLQEAVAMDNKMFAQEIEDWDKEQARKSMSEPDATVTYEHRPSTFVCFSTPRGRLELVTLNVRCMGNCCVHGPFRECAVLSRIMLSYVQENQPGSLLFINLYYSA